MDNDFLNQIIQGAFDESPAAVQDAFNSEMATRIGPAIEARKADVAATMFQGERDEDV